MRKRIVLVLITMAMMAVGVVMLNSSTTRIPASCCNMNVDCCCPDYYGMISGPILYEYWCICSEGKLVAGECTYKEYIAGNYDDPGDPGNNDYDPTSTVVYDASGNPMF